MHLKFGYFVLYTPIYQLTGEKKRFHVENCPCETVGAKLVYMLGLLLHGNAVFEFGRKVILVDFLLIKTLNMVKISLT